VHQIAQIKRSQDDGKSLMELQISKLRETIEMKDFEYESLKTQMKSETEQLKNQNSLLESEIDHQRKLKDLELNEITRRSRDDMRSALKHLELEKNVEIRQFENRIAKLKKDLSNKDMELEQQAKKTTGENEEIYLELSSIKQEKQYLLEEIQALTETTQQKIVREKERIAQLADLEKENLENLFRNEKESLVGEKQKLILLCNEKSE
jgi:predicted  nucleic acid-binding Zn-ribbon protein